MVNHSSSITTVIFNVSTLISGLAVGKPDVMPHAFEALKFLRDNDIRLVACGTDNNVTAELLHQFNMASLFTWQEELQVISPSQETDRARELDMKPETYHSALQNFKDIDGNDNCAVIAGDFTEIQIARASGIKTVVGFYGSPDIEIGKLHTHKASLERNIAALAGTNITTANLREVPELLGFHAQ